MDFGALQIYFVRKRGYKVGVKLVLAAFLCNIPPCSAKAFHKFAHIFRHFLFPTLEALLQQLQFKPSVADKRIQKRNHNARSNRGGKGRRLVKVGAAEYSVIHMHIAACGKQTYKRTAERTAVCGADMSSEIFFYVFLNLLRFLKHSRKFRVLRFVKSII